MTAHLGDRLSAFLDGELPADVRAAVEGHLRTCAACAHELEELAAVDALAREVPVQAPPGYFESLPGRVRSRVRARRRPRPVVAVWIGAVAAAVLVAVVAPTALRHAPQMAEAPARSVAAPPQALPVTAAPVTAPPVEESVPRALSVPPQAKALAKAGARTDAVAPADNRLQEREERSAAPKLQRAEPGPARNAAPAVPPPAAPSERVLEADRVRQAAPKGEAEAPAGFAAAPVAAPTVAAAATPAAPARKERDELTDRRSAPAQAPAASKDLQAQSAVDADKADGREQAAGASSGRAAPAPEHKAPVAGLIAGHAALSADQRFEALRTRRPATVAEARALRDGWEAFARDLPADARADEARVRAIEAGAAAWRLGTDAADLARTRAAAAAYLSAEGATQKERVRALLDTLPRPPQP